VLSGRGEAVTAGDVENGSPAPSRGHDPTVAGWSIPAWAKLIDFDTTLPSAVEELVRQREQRQRA
jgi:hypothetical protein